MNFIKICLISILTLATLVACSEDKDKDKGGEGLNNVLNLTLGKKVIDDNKVKSTNLLITDKEGVPVSGATVLFGEDIDHPFKDNQLITDNNGEVALPKNWTAPLPITIEAPGFIRITYTRVEPVAQTLQMDKVEAKNFIEVSGVTTDYGRLRSDGFIDFSLIIPAFTQRSMINFDLSSVISPVNDTLSVAGKNFELPSNISLPRQTESYIFPITFEKPVYRAFIRNPGFYKLFATHGRFPFKKVIDDFRSGKSVFEVINKFDFNGGGQKDLQINKNMNNQDISIRQVAFDQTVQVQAPNFVSDLEMVSLSLVNQGGYFYPADLKRIQPGETRALKYPSSATDAYVLSALVSKDAVPADVSRELEGDDEINLMSFFTIPKPFQDITQNIQPKTAGLSLTLAFEHADTSQPVSFIDFVDAPVINNNIINLDVPQISNEISPMATYVTLSEIEELGSGKVKSEKKTRMWDFLAGGWQSQVTIPKMNVDFDANKSYRWEVLFLGRKGNSPVSGGHLLDGITHVSRSSFNF